MIVFPDDELPYRSTGPQPRPEEPEAPSGGEVFGSAMVLNNWPYRVYRAIENRHGLIEREPGYNPLDDIRGTKYEADPERFAGAVNPRQVQAIMREWDEDETARGVYARSGWGGTVAGVAAGMLDPTIFMPVAKVFSGAAQGYRALHIAGDAAFSGLAGSVIAEGAMALTTPEYTREDAARGIATGTILSGLIGGGAGALLSRAERQAAEEGLQRFREDWGADIEAHSPDAMGHVPLPGQAASVGAAASDTRRLDLVKTPLGIVREKVKDLPGGKVASAVLTDQTARLSPLRRVFDSPFVSARRAVADLVETPYVFEENRQGIATTQGAALSTTAKIAIDRGLMAASEKLDELYTRHRFGEAGASGIAKRLASAADALGRPRDRASFSEFKDMIDEAMRNGDTHTVPEVAEAAAFLRRTIFDPWKDEAVKAGFFGDDVDVKTAASYMMRRYNKEIITARRPEFVGRVQDWLTSEQTRKAGLQSRLEELSDRLDGYEAALARPGDDPTIRLEAEENARAIRAEIEEALEAWGGKSAREALSAMEARTKAEDARQAKIDAGDYQGKAERLTGADKAVGRAVKRILASNRDLSPDELLSQANEITDRVLGGPDGRLPYDAPSGGARTGVPSSEPRPRGPMLQRQFMIPDAMIREFLHTDIMETVSVYLRTMVPDTMLAQRFGDVDMSEAFRKLNEEHAQLSAAAKTDAERVKLSNQWKGAQEDLAAMRDKVRGTFGYSSSTLARRSGRVAAMVSRYNVLADLGSALFASVADVATPIFRYGFASTFRDGWAPMAKALLQLPEAKAAVASTKRQLKAMGIAAETHLATRHNALSDVTDVYAPQSKFERGLDYATQKYSVANLMAPWTDMAKTMSAMVSGAEISRAARRLSTGKASAREITRMAEAGIDATMAARIWKQLQAEGGSDVLHDVRLPNTETWADAGARDAFEGALARDVNLMVLTPGFEKPLFMSSPVIGLITQYKSIVQAANERILFRALQNRDAAALQGLVGATVAGMFVQVLRSYANDEKLPATPADWIKEGVSRSGVLGWLGEVNASAAKFSPHLDLWRLIGGERPEAKFSNRSLWSTMLGPTAGKIERLIGTASTIGGLDELDWTAGNTRAVRQIAIGQNHLLLKYLFNAGEQEVNEWMDIEPLEKKN